MDINNVRDMYKGQSCFLICDGPSFKTVDKDKLKGAGIVTMGVNNSPASFRPDLWCAVDSPNNFIRSIFPDGNILKFVPKAYNKKYSAPVVGFNTNTDFSVGRFLPENTISYGCSAEDGGGRSVMLAAIKILYVLGFRNVFLLGVDFSMKNGEDNYHFAQDTNKHCVRVNNNTYVKLIRRFTQLKPLFDENDFSIYNCNPDSELKVFPFISLDDAINCATEYMPDVESEKTEGMYDKGWVRKKPNVERRNNRKKRARDGMRNNMIKAEPCDMHVKNQIAITGISRSGTHAVSNWICSQLNGHVEWRNDLSRRICEKRIFDPNDEMIPERWYSLPSLSYEGVVDHMNNVDHLVYTYENQDGSRFNTHKRVKSEGSKRVVLLRDPFNLIASLAKHIEDGHKFWFYHRCTTDGVIDAAKLHLFAKLWMSHANLLDNEDNVGLLYNKWKSDVDYRDELFKRLELDNRSDDSMSRVPVNGGGSSFDKRSKDGSAQQMENNSRWKKYKDEPWFIDFISKNVELVEKSKELFGDILNAEG